MPIAINCQSFGSLPAATFGGSGIPNSSVCKATIVDGNNTITLGLEASERFKNPVVTNDGAGTYFAGAGENFGDPTFATKPGNNLGSTWNEDIYVNIAGGGKLSDYAISFLYEVDPAAANDRANFGNFNISAIAPAGATNFQDSENLDFKFFCTGVVGFVRLHPAPASTRWCPASTTPRLMSGVCQGPLTEGHSS